MATPLDAGTTAAAAGLASAAAWGAGDFTGGIAARRLHVFRVVAVSQAIGLALLLLLALLVEPRLPPSSDFAWGVAAGLAGAVGVTSLYAALASGRMGVAAPITGVLAAALPVAVASVTEGSPGALRLAGFGLAIAGILLVTRPDGGIRTPRRVLLLALVAGLGFAGFLTLIDRASDTSILWPLVAARAASTTLLAALVLARRRQDGPFAARAWPWPLLVGNSVLDAAGNAFFVLAAALGRLDVAAVLSSLYPAATVLLARIVLRERITRTQTAGLTIAMAAIVMIAW